ncbi:hypothetical protein [uncultured Catenibacterium sp.]|uniref:hypothetical protein n=1 Tax=uncultured Catenibacterium sp. TaxID=286142 RepID=UPI002604FE58|nr:hypothetical protein [uncultured Catenibacterium sp.]
MKKILLENALESWASAIYYCDEIIAGKATLANKKHFVNSLQNAIELFVKQQMLNVTDYRVAEVKHCDSNGQPLKDYLSSTDLNQYFCNISTTDRDKFVSISFNDIIVIQKELFSEFYGDKGTYIINELKTLKKLRNNETHFYISDIDFMSDKEFQDLHNMMIVFYEILQEYDLLPYWGEAYAEYKKFKFNRKSLTNFSYERQLKNSAFVKSLKENIEKELFFNNYRNESYSITEDIVYCSDKYSESDFNEIWAYIEMLMKYNMFKIEEVNIPDKLENGIIIHSSSHRYYVIDI